MTTSIPNSNSSLSATGAAGAPAAAALLDAFAAAFANSAGTQEAGTVQAAGIFANLLTAPAASVASANAPAVPPAVATPAGNGPAKSVSLFIAAPGRGLRNAPAILGNQRLTLAPRVGSSRQGAGVSASTATTAGGQTQVSRSLVETVASLLAPILQSLQLPAVAGGESGGTVSVGQGELGQSLASSSAAARSPVSPGQPASPVDVAALMAGPSAAKVMRTALASPSQGPSRPGIAGQKVTPETRTSSQTSSSDTSASGQDTPPLQVAIDFGPGNPALTFSLPAGQALPTMMDIEHAVQTALGHAAGSLGGLDAKSANIDSRSLAVSSGESDAGENAVNAATSGFSVRVSPAVDAESGVETAASALPNPARPADLQAGQGLRIAGVASVTGGADAATTTSAIPDSELPPLQPATTASALHVATPAARDDAPATATGVGASAGIRAATSTGSITVTVLVPSERLAADATVAAPASSSDALAARLPESMAKIAVADGAPSVDGRSTGGQVEKNFLDASGQRVTSGAATTGISVAHSGANMPANFTARRNPANLPDPILPIVLRETSVAAAPVASAPARAETTSTPAPVLAHRAVETVWNVVDAQTNRPPTAGVVNLHFKFGGEDLDVRVQMRGGEVHTQFNTNSPDLRTALSNEWRAVAGQGTQAGLRLADPVFAASPSGQGFGSASNGQFSSQQNPHQQAPASAVVLPVLRSGSTDASASTEEAGAPARHPAFLPTSLHLAAVA